MKRVITDWKTESKRFDALAEIYDRYRPSYPAEMIEAILELVELNAKSRLLEIGAGSGKATELFVSRGFHTTCIEPGEKLAARGTEKFKGTNLVEYRIGRFEELDHFDSEYDLVFSAQAFHWVPRPKGFELVAKALEPEGMMALVWNLYLKNGTEEDERLSQLCREYSVMFLMDRKGVEQTNADWSNEIRECGLFEEPQVFEFPWSVEQSYEEFHQFLLTSSGYVGLDDHLRTEFDREAKDIFEDAGGVITQEYCCVLYTAKKSM